MSAHDLTRRHRTRPGGVLALALALALLGAAPTDAGDRFVLPGGSSAGGSGSHFAPMQPEPSRERTEPAPAGPEVTWRRWESPRYRFAIDVPDDLVPDPGASDADALALRSRDRRIDVRVYARPNPGGLDLATMRSRTRAGMNGATFDYDRSFPDNFVLSGIHDGHGVYIRVHLAADRSVFTFLVISHPRNLSQTASEMVTRLSKSLVAAQSAGAAPSPAAATTAKPPEPAPPPTSETPTTPRSTAELERLKLQAEIERLKLEQLKLSQGATASPAKDRDVAAPPPPPAGRRVALVIGNGAYVGVPKLPTPVRDATRMAVMLRGLGFEVTVGTDLARSAMTADLATLYDQAKGADVALFYFSGHGVQVNGHNYLLPTDARFDDPQAALDIDGRAVDLQKYINAAGGAKTVLAFVDACRDNPIVEESMAKTFYKSVGGQTKGLAVVPRETLAPGQFIGFAADEGRTAQTGVGDVSVYTDALLRMLPTPGEDISVLHRRIRLDVEKATGGQQSPRAVDDLRGAMILSPRR